MEGSALFLLTCPNQFAGGREGGREAGREGGREEGREGVRDMHRAVSRGQM